MYSQARADLRAKMALLLRRRIGSQREDRDFDDLIRHKTYQIVMFSMIGLSVMVCLAIVTFYNYDSPLNVDAYYDDPLVPAWILNLMYFGQVFITITTFVAILLIWQKYQLLLMLKRAEWSNVNVYAVQGGREVTVKESMQRKSFEESYRFIKSNLFWECMLEIFVHLFQPIIWAASYKNVPATPEEASKHQVTNVGYKLLQLAMFLRLYLVRDVIHLSSSAFAARFEIVNADPELKSVSFQVGVGLTTKMFQYAYPTTAFVVVSAGCIFVFGYSIFAVERQEGLPIEFLTKNTIRPADAFWFSFYTLRTIGYGDFNPQTLLGRVLAALCAIIGTSTVIVFTAVLVSKAPLSKEQKQGVEFLRTKEADDRLREAAMRLVQTAVMTFWFPKICDKYHGGRKPSWATRYLQPQGHKGNRIYFAIKHFRNAKRGLEASFSEVQDVVMNIKMDAVLTLSRALKREVHEQDARLADVEGEILQGMRKLLNRVAEYKRRGNCSI
jgi:hypothetical protein